MKFTFLYSSALGHAISLLDSIIRQFVMIFGHSAQTGPIVIESSFPSVLPSQRAGKGDSDGTSPHVPLYHA